MVFREFLSAIVDRVMASSAKWRKDRNKEPKKELECGEQEKVLEVFKQYGEAPRHEAISRKVTDWLAGRKRGI